MIEYSGLLPAIEDYAQNVWVGVPITVTATGIAKNKRLPPELEYLLFRIVQEAVTNAAKHAQASSIEIELNREVGLTHLTIQDDGIGFDPAGVGNDGRPGLGLVTMRVRAESAGGRCSVYSLPGKGTRISVEI
jgi:signal transduction histidine kinase